MQSIKQQQHCFSNEADKAGFSIILENLEEVGAIVFYHHSFFEIKQEGRNNFILYVRNNEGLDSTIAYNAVENYLEKKKIEKMCKQASEKYMVSSDDSDWSAIDPESETSDNLVEDIEERMKTLLTSSEKRPTRVVKFQDEEEKIVEEYLEEEKEVDESLLDTSVNVNVSPVEEKVVNVDPLIDNDIKTDLTKIVKYVESQIQRQAEKERLNKEDEELCKKMDEEHKKRMAENNKKSEEERKKRQQEAAEQQALWKAQDEEREKRRVEDYKKWTASAAAKKKREQDHMNWLTTTLNDTKANTEALTKELMEIKKNQEYLIQTGIAKIVNYVDNQIEKQMEQDRMKEEEKKPKILNLADCIKLESKNCKKQHEMFKEKRDNIEKMQAELQKEISGTNNIKKPEVSQTSYEIVQAFVKRRNENRQKALEAKNQQADCMKVEPKNWDKQHEMVKEKRENLENMKAELQKNNSEANNIKMPVVKETPSPIVQSFVIHRMETRQKFEEMEAKNRQETGKQEKPQEPL